MLFLGMEYLCDRGRRFTTVLATGNSTGLLYSIVWEVSSNAL